MGKVQKISDAVVEFFQELDRRGREVNSTGGFACTPEAVQGKITRRG